MTYPDNGNVIARPTKTHLSVADVAEVKKDIGESATWDYTNDPNVEGYVNKLQKGLYRQLDDIVDQAGPEVADLNRRLGNTIEARRLQTSLRLRIGSARCAGICGTMKSFRRSTHTPTSRCFPLQPTHRLIKIPWSERFEAKPAPPCKDSPRNQPRRSTNMRTNSTVQ